MGSDTKTTPSASSTNQRTKKFVDRLVQGTMLRRVIIHWTAYITVSFVVGLAFTWMLDPFCGQREILMRFLTSHGPSLIVALLLIPAFAGDTVRVTHRIVGPMVRIRRELRHLAEGRPAKRMTFRPDDFWHEIGDEFNTLCDFVEPQLNLSNVPSDHETTTLAT